MAAVNHHPPHHSTFDDDDRTHNTMSGPLDFITARDERGLRRPQARESGVGSGGGGRMADVETEISATQKMLAACSGSLLTSLLGLSSPLCPVSLWFRPIYIYIANDRGRQ